MVGDDELEAVRQYRDPAEPRDRNEVVPGDMDFAELGPDIYRVSAYAELSEGPCSAPTPRTPWLPAPWRGFSADIAHTSASGERVAFHLLIISPDGVDAVEFAAGALDVAAVSSGR